MTSNNKRKTTDKKKKQLASKNIDNTKKNSSPTVSDVSDSETHSTSPKNSSSGSSGSPPKKARVFDDKKDMDEDFLLNNTIDVIDDNNNDEFFDAENTHPLDASSERSTKSGAVVPPSTPGTTTADKTPRGSPTDKATNPTADQTLNKESTATNAIPSNISQHEKNGDDVIMDDETVPSNAAAVSAGTSCFQAAAAISDLLKEGETRKQLVNRLTTYMIEKYESFSRAALNGSIAEGIIIVSLKSVGDHKAFTDGIHSELVPKEGADAPKFFNYDSKAILADEKSRSIILRDIPLFVNKEMIISGLKKYGIIAKSRVFTPNGASFQQAEITFTDTTQVKNIAKRWSIFIGGECIRIYPASFSNDQCQARGQFAAVLRGIKPNIKAIDLISIYSQVNAAAIGLPRSPKSYYSRPWAYFFFQSEEALNAAMEITCSFNDRPVEWILPKDVKKLCVRCSSPNHKPSDCDAFTRGRKSAPKNIQALYNKFSIHQPRGRTNVKSSGLNDNNPRGSSSRSRSRSKLRNNGDKRVSYADKVRSGSSSNKDSNDNSSSNNVNNENRSLNQSIHSPKNCPSNKGKNPDRDPKDHDENIKSLDKQALTSFALAAQTITKQLNELSARLEMWCNFMTNIDQRLSNIERVCGANATPNQPNIPEPIIPEHTSIPVSDQLQSIQPPLPQQPFDVQTEVANMKSQFGGDLAAAIQQMNSFCAKLNPFLTDSAPESASSSNNNSSQ